MLALHSSHLPSDIHYCSSLGTCGFCSPLVFFFFPSVVPGWAGEHIVQLCETLSGAGSFKSCMTRMESCHLIPAWRSRSYWDSWLCSWKRLKISPGIIYVSNWLSAGFVSSVSVIPSDLKWERAGGEGGMGWGWAGTGNICGLLYQTKKAFDFCKGRDTLVMLLCMSLLRGFYVCFPPLHRRYTYPLHLQCQECCVFALPFMHWTSSKDTDMKRGLFWTSFPCRDQATSPYFKNA